MKLIQIHFPKEMEGQLRDILDEKDCVDWTIDDSVGRFDKEIDVIVRDGEGQAVIEAMEKVLEPRGDWRITVLPVLSTLPRPEQDEEKAEKPKAQTLQEELYQSVLKGCQPNINYAVLTLLSAVVATLGLNMDNVAVVIGAMVIAPLLGPVLAFSLGTALGDMALLKRATQTAAFGIGLSFGLAFVIGLLIDVNLNSQELLDRAVFGPEMAVLALASGAAAALSLSTGQSSALVGVMVAVALLPPTVASALFLGGGDIARAGPAALLLALNVVCVLLAAQLVFLWKGTRSKNWWEKEQAKKSTSISLILWVIMIAAMVALTVVISN